MAIIYTNADVVSAVNAIVVAFNQLHDGYARTVSTFHRDITGIAGGTPQYPTSTALQVTAATASSLLTSANLAHNIQAVMRIHFADDRSHLIADDVNVGFEDGYFTDPSTATLAQVEALLNACKSDFNKHLTQSGVHVNNDGSNTVTAPDATDQTSANTLANQMKTKVNAHINSGPSFGGIVVLP